MNLKDFSIESCFHQTLPFVVCSKLISGNWEEIKYEISLSNVIQRDSAVFARKLEKNLYQFATEKEEQGSLFRSRLKFKSIKSSCSYLSQFKKPSSTGSS